MLTTTVETPTAPERDLAIAPAVHGPAAGIGKPTVEIEPVEGHQALRRFVSLPETLYAEDPFWVPPLLREEMRFFSPANPYMCINPTRLFLARCEGQVVGRVAATVCRQHNAFHGERTGFFGFFDCDGEPETAGALFAAVADFLRREGMEAIRGPFNLTTNHTSGLLIEGFDGPPVVEMPYNPPLYAHLLEEEGFRKVKDLLAYWVDLPGDSAHERALAQIAARAPQRYRVRGMGLKGRALARDMEAFHDLYHHAWRNNWGFVPLDRKEYTFLLQRMKPILTPGLCQVAEADGEPAGIFIGIPDFNQVLPLLGGRLTPLGVARAWWAGRRIDAARYLLTGIYDRYRGTPVAALLLHHCLAAARARGYKGVEISWVLEDNEPANRFFTKHGARVYRRYRVYERSLG